MQATFYWYVKFKPTFLRKCHSCLYRDNIQRINVDYSDPLRLTRAQETPLNKTFHSNIQASVIYMYYYHSLPRDQKKARV